MSNMYPMQGQGMNVTQPQYPQYGPSSMRPQFVPSTNKQFVRSLEEALSLPANLNSQNVYFDANKDVMYDICTNGQGEKSWQIFGITRQNIVQPAPMPVVQTSDLDARLSKIEKFMEELVNGKYDVKQTDSANAGPQ